MQRQTFGTSDSTQQPNKGRSAHYRPAIDGLRAVAIILVVAFHVGVPGFSGGFVGVDIFFAISGFLITGLLYRELAAQIGITLPVPVGSPH